MRARPSSPAPTGCWAPAGPRRCSTRGGRRHRPASATRVRARRSCSRASRSASTSSHGDVDRRRRSMDRALGEYEVDTVFHLAAQTIVGDRAALAAGDLRGQHPRHLDVLLEACRRHEVARVGRGRLRQGLRRPRRAALPRGHARCSRASPTTSRKAATDLIARSYWHTYGLPVATTRFANLYGGGDLNRSRLVPEAVDAALAGRAPGDPLRRHARARLPLRRGRGGGLPGASPTRSTATAPRGEAFNAGGGEPHARARGRRR